MKTTEHDDGAFCLRCGHIFTASSAAPTNPDAVPSVGDVTLCISCAEPHRYVSVSPLRLERQDIAELDAETRAAVERYQQKLLTMPWNAWRIRGERGA